MTNLLIAAASAALLAAAPAYAQSEGLSSIQSGTYEMDKGHGYVTFSYSHLGFSNPILRFDDVDATVELDAEDPTASTLTVEIDPASIDSGVEKFDTHLKSADFFNVEEYGDITFTSTELTMEDDNTGTLTGDLTIKGVTKPVTLDVVLNGAMTHPMAGVDAFGITATGEIMRSEWDLGAYVPNVGDEVTLRIEAEFLRQE